MTDSKALTLTYGKYACTLVGFEDSFHAIPAIAAYFRDMALQDAAPDADTLADIVEHAAGQAVMVQQNDAGFVLRIGDQRREEVSTTSGAPQHQPPAVEETADLDPEGFFANSKSILNGAQDGNSSQIYEEDEPEPYVAHPTADAAGDALQLERIQQTLLQRRSDLRSTPPAPAPQDPAPTLQLTQNARVADVTGPGDGAGDTGTSNLFTEEPAHHDKPDGARIIVPARPVAKTRRGEVNRTALNAALTSGGPTDDTPSDLPEATPPEASGSSAPGNQNGDTAPARQRLPAWGERPNKDISRLMAEADHQMEEPGGATRRSAFTHLRAAVAVRGADDSLDKAQSAEATAEPYRTDLAEAVTPRRPHAAGNQRGGARPLKLLAEQRVNIDAALPTDHAGQGRSDDGQHPGFVDAAGDTGQKSLPDLLEAAAAYLSFIKGHEQFSKAQLLGFVEQARIVPLNRDEGRRAFGQLLHNGKIKRVEDGWFAATSALASHPVAQNAR